MTDAPATPASPSTPNAASDAAVLSSLTEADAGAVLGSLSAEAESASSAAAADEDTGTRSALDQMLEHTDLTRISDMQLADLESGDPGRIEAALAAAQLPTAQDADGAPVEGPAAALSGPARVSIKALKPEDRARTVRALDLIRAGHTPAEAFAEVFGISGAPQQAAAHELPQVEMQAQDIIADPFAAEAFPQLAQLEGQLSHLQQQYRTAKETYDPAATDLLEQMTDVKMDLRDARREAAAVSNEWMGHQTHSLTRAMDQFSNLIADESSGFLPHCDDEILLAEAKMDPVLDQPDWPEKIGRRVIEKFYSGHAARSPSSARGAFHVPPAPRQSVRLPGSPVGHAFSAGALSPQTALAEIDQLTPEMQDAFIRSLDRLTSAHANMRR